MAEIKEEVIKCNILILILISFRFLNFSVFDLWLRSDDRAAPARPPLHVFWPLLLHLRRVRHVRRTQGRKDLQGVPSARGSGLG